MTEQLIEDLPRHLAPLIHPDPTSGCWLWSGRRTGSNGYGGVNVDGKPKRVHRLVWEAVNGTIPDGLCVLHKCDVPPCCNPAHLFLGTHQENMADRDAKGRHAHGERSGAAKLTEGKIREIRALAAGGRSGRSIAREFGVDHRVIGRVIRREAWRHVK